MPLEEARKKIDRIDGELVRLLDERARVGVEIGRIKNGMGLAFRNPGREEEVLRRLLGLSDGSFPAEGLERIFRAVMAETLALQESGYGCPGHAASGKRDVAATVVENDPVAPGFFRMRVSAPSLAGAFLPGQFFQLRFGEDGDGWFLRRPFAPSEYLPDGFRFVYAVVGGGTAYMAGMRPGARVEVLAPLGNAFSVVGGGSALLFGGGCGSPSLAPLAWALCAVGVRVTVVLGARSVDALLSREAFPGAARVVVATDDGSCGCRGTVVDAYRAECGGERFDRMYACGPVPMLRAASGLAAEAGVVCEVSLEERMACGFGACMGCVVPVVWDGGTVYRRVCHDGPVFDSRVLSWSDMR